MTVLGFAARDRLAVPAAPSPVPVDESGCVGPSICVGLQVLSRANSGIHANGSAARTVGSVAVRNYNGRRRSQWLTK